MQTADGTQREHRWWKGDTQWVSGGGGGIPRGSVIFRGRGAESLHQFFQEAPIICAWPVASFRAHSIEQACCMLLLEGWVTVALASNGHDAHRFVWEKGVALTLIFRLRFVQGDGCF